MSDQLLWDKIRALELEVRSLKARFSNSSARRPVSGSTTIVSPHGLLSNTHPDTTPFGPVKGAIIRGDDAGDKWELYPIDSRGTVLTSLNGQVAWLDPVPLTKFIAPDAYDAGTVVVKTSNNYFNVSGVLADEAVIGVTLDESLAPDNVIRVQHAGYIANLRVWGAVSPGYHLWTADQTDTGGIYGLATATGSVDSEPMQPGTFAYALGTNVAGEGLIAAFIFPVIHTVAGVGVSYIPFGSEVSEGEVYSP